MTRARALLAVPFLVLPLAACGVFPGGEGPFTLLLAHADIPDSEECVDDLCTGVEDMIIANDSDFATLGSPTLSIERASGPETFSVLANGCPASLQPGQTCEIKVKAVFDADDGVTLVATAGFHQGRLTFGGVPV